MFRKILGGKDLVTAEITFHRDKTVRVVWTHHLSTDAGPEIERLWLTSIYYGSVLTSFRGYDDLQRSLAGTVTSIASNLMSVEYGSPAQVEVPLGVYRLVDNTASSVEKSYQTVLYRNRGNSFVNRDKHTLGQEALYAPLSALSLIASNQREYDDDTLRFMGMWLRGMHLYYANEKSYSSFGSSLFATQWGFQLASTAQADLELLFES